MNDVKIIREAISPDFAKYMELQMDMWMDFIGQPTDQMPIVKGAVAWYAPIFLESLLVHLQPLVENYSGKKLWPTYSYGRIYSKGGEMPRHIDREANEYGISLNLGKDIDYPLFIEPTPGKVIECELNPGDMVIYKGMEWPHWRHIYDGKKHTQAFLLYVDKDGPYSQWKFDRRPGLIHSGKDYKQFLKQDKKKKKRKKSNLFQVKNLGLVDKHGNLEE